MCHLSSAKGQGKADSSVCFLREHFVMNTDHEKEIQGQQDPIIRPPNLEGIKVEIMENSHRLKRGSGVMQNSTHITRQVNV